MTVNEREYLEISKKGVGGGDVHDSKGKRLYKKKGGGGRGGK